MENVSLTIIHGAKLIMFASNNNRNIGLDIYRISAVLVIFMFHSWIHLQCDYGIFMPFIQMGAIYMTAFFLLSGFVLYLTYQKKDLSNINDVKLFYKKRLINILPAYYVVALLFIVLIGKESFSENLLLAPVEFLLMQSSFMSIFNVSHNNGTWFVSCILFCYLIYPFIQEMIKQSGVKTKIVILLLAGFILLYSPLIVNHFNTISTYADPFYRILEFMMGVILCSFTEDIQKMKISKYIFSIWAILIEYTVLIIVVTAAVEADFHVNDYMLYNWFTLPLFILLLLSMYGADFKIHSSKITDYICKISYTFFLVQIFAWKSTSYIIDNIGIDTNIVKILLSLLLCILFSILVHELVEKPTSVILNRRNKIATDNQ